MTQSSLGEFISEVASKDYLRIEEDLGEGFVRLRVSEAERRQARHDIRCVEDIVIEMLRNARDAGADRVFLANSRTGDMRTLVFLDNGSGVPERMLSLIFEPRITSKLDSMVMDPWGIHGRGMALYSIAQNTLSARVLDSGKGLGTAFLIKVDLNRLSEKADQATTPALKIDDRGEARVGRGPHNVVRAMTEFSLQTSAISVYLGTPTEVLATLCALGAKRLDESLRGEDCERLPLWLRPAAAKDPGGLVHVASSLGLSVSERTARRIIAGSIAPLVALPSQASLTERGTADRPSIDLLRDRRGLKLAAEDLDSFKNDLARAFQPLAQRYFLSPKGGPRVTVSGNSIRVRFDFEKDT